MGIIYLITNNINNKKYVGQTIQKLYKRWGDHKCGVGNCKALKAAFKKYGVDNFTIEPILTVLNKKELDQWEMYFIKYYDTFGKNGYNLSYGGHTDGSEFLKKPIIGYNPKTKEILQFDCINVTKQYGFDTRAIHRCLKGEYTKHKKYLWFYKIDFTGENIKNSINKDFMNILNHTRNIPNKTSSYRGVHKQITNNKWSAVIDINGKTKNLGYFNTEIEAYNIYKLALWEYLYG